MQFNSKAYPFLKVAQKVMFSIENWITHHSNSLLRGGGVSVPLGSFVDLSIELDHAVSTNNNGIPPARVQL